jgi:hypothetical protein
MKIDINKKYRTSDAKWPVTIVSVNGPYPGFPVVGYAHAKSNPLLCQWTEAGGYPGNTNLDLIEVREPREWEITCYDDGSMRVNIGGLASPRGETIRVREIID